MVFDEASLHHGLAIALLVSGIGACLRLSLGGSQAPYGRYNAGGHNKTTRQSRQQHGYGPNVPARLAWFWMESPNLWATLICLFWPGLPAPACTRNPANQLLLALFALHYAQRALLYPLLMPPTTRPMPVGIMALAWLFCACNGFLQARWLTALHPYPSGWVRSPMFMVGVALFALGFALNVHADAVLRGLARRRTQEQQSKGKGKGKGSGYAVPHGGLFRFVSAANYAAEMVEWVGFAVAGGLQYPGVVFAAFTFLNLAPRGVSHHEWYKSEFGSKYPKGRRALIPFVY